ncbi:MAG: CotH kinase family protein [Alphaproteobacteria bacterium]|nr:CotH kinase family protein [Alphaproteobacteria bacterium]
MWPLILAVGCGPVSIKVDDSGPASIDDSHTLVGDTDIEDIPGTPSDSDVLFDQSRMPVLELELSSSSYNALQRNPYEYVEGTLIYDGVRYEPIGVRTKGENSWRPINQKSSLKLDFNRYEGGPGRFLGLKGLTLNAMNEDYSMMHERVAYWLYRKAGVPASRANHAIVHLNGELYGLFALLDTIDDVFLGRWFEDTSGSLYEQHDGDYTDAYVQNNTYFQLEEGEGDRSGLQWVADALENSGPDAVALAGERLDWEAFHRYWAAGSIVMNFDAYPFRFAGDDCHVYDDPTRGKLVYIPHGVDESFYYNDNFEARAAGHLSARCREVQSCRDDWALIVYDVLQVAESEDMLGFAETVREQIADAAEADPNRNYSWSNVRAYQQDMIDKIERRRASVVDFIGPPPE